MFKLVPVGIFLLCFCSWVLAQEPPDSSREKLPPPPANHPLPRSDESRSPESSSSKDTKVDLSPPKDDAKNHPYSTSSVEGDEPSEVQEFHPWDPHKAAKDIEVGDYYFKRKNYRAAEDRYREALVYKPNDALATFHLGETLEKLGELDEARAAYAGYLNVLPKGPLAPDVHKALERLKKLESKNAESPK
jgi:tetratricopeptide (TPR) repeat protein